MNTRVETLRFGDAEVLVSVVQPPGSRDTGPEGRVMARAVDALEAAQGTIEAVAATAQRTIAGLKEKGTCPSQVELQVGLAFTVSGGVVIAGGSVAASISVHLRYDT